jgi:AraC-like DNA-binding protein
MTLLSANRCHGAGRFSRAAAPPDGALGYGALSSIEKDNIYWFGGRGFFFTSPWVVTTDTMRYPAVLLLTASGRPLELKVGDRVTPCSAAAIAPMTRRGLCAADVGLISVHVETCHPRFRAFRRIARPGVLALDRKAFERLDLDLHRAYQGRLSIIEARQLFEDLVETTVAQLPRTGRGDSQSDCLRAFLRDNPTCSLSDIARELNVSYESASRHFARAIGLPLRSYRFGLKCRRASKRLLAEVPLTQIAHEAGFTDSAHFTRTWRRSYGHPPSYTRDTGHVRVFA